MADNDLSKRPAGIPSPPKHRQTLGDILAMIFGVIVFAMAVVLVILWFGYGYITCFQAKLPAGTEIGHFERCVLGLRGADE